MRSCCMGGDFWGGHAEMCYYTNPRLVAESRQKAAVALAEYQRRQKKREERMAISGPPPLVFIGVDEFAGVEDTY